MATETYDRVMSAPDPQDRIALGCEECDNYLTHRDMWEDCLADVDWEDLGDDGVLCPECAAKVPERCPDCGVEYFPHEAGCPRGAVRQ